MSNRLRIRDVPSQETEAEEPHDPHHYVHTARQDAAMLVHQITMDIVAFLSKPTHRNKARLDVVLYDYLIGVIRRQVKLAGLRGQSRFALIRFAPNSEHPISHEETNARVDHRNL
jgi:hypothetical protein